MRFIEDLAARRRFGMKPGLDTIRGLCAALGDPQRRFAAIHVAGTNGKGAVTAILDAALRRTGLHVGRYTSPHLVQLNERFFLDGAPVDDTTLECLGERISTILSTPQPLNSSPPQPLNPTYFEALTAVAFLIYAEKAVDVAILECGLGGRLDATNICRPSLCVITRIGLDHCDWLGDTIERIAAEKAGIIKPGVPVVLGANDAAVRAVIERHAKELGAPFHYAPDLAQEGEIPEGFSLAGAFNRENAVTALAALKVYLGATDGSRRLSTALDGFSDVVWPGRFQRVGDFIVDGAHNPPAARALVASLAGFINASTPQRLNASAHQPFTLIAGFCGDKDVDEVLAILAPCVARGFAVRTGNPRSLQAEATAAKMRAAGIDAIACPSLDVAIAAARPSTSANAPRVLICGSLFLAGEALVALGAYPWPARRADPPELLSAPRT